MPSEALARPSTHTNHGLQLLQSDATTMSLSLKSRRLRLSNSKLKPWISQLLALLLVHKCWALVPSQGQFQDASTGGKMELPIRFAQGYYLIWPDKGRSAPQQPKDAAYIPLSLITRLCSKSSKAPRAGICKDQFTWKSLPLIQKNM